MAESTKLTLEQAVPSGMIIAYHAQERPDEYAVICDDHSLTFDQLNQRCNQLAHFLREKGLRPGDAIAVLVSNRPEFIIARYAAFRIGLRFTAVNWHLTPAEVAYIVDNCEAKAFVSEAQFSAAAVAGAQQGQSHLLTCLSVDGGIPGFEPLYSAIENYPTSNIDNPELGDLMLYTSGTTGKPKGVFRRNRAPAAASPLTSAGRYRAGDHRTLLTGPAYHAAPLAFNIVTPLLNGVGVVMMEKWEPEQTLALIEKHRITHTHMVATMFHRLLNLPKATRDKYDVSSLKFVLHGAAPCPVHVKHAMIDWFGPIIFEYYAATEGGGGFIIDSPTWLKKPGSVGKPATEGNTKVLDDDGNELPPNEKGTIYFEAPETGRFEYYKDQNKTDSAYRGNWFTLGDMGYFDEDGYLFLTGRDAETIISGGVNIYPQEIDDAILKHPKVLDVCTIGVPNDEWGEEVKSVVQLQPELIASDELKAEIMAFAKTELPGYKCPRSIDFTDDLPRMASGKIQRKKVREPYWAGRQKSI